MDDRVTYRKALLPFMRVHCLERDNISAIIDLSLYSMVRSGFKGDLNEEVCK